MSLSANFSMLPPTSLLFVCNSFGSWVMWLLISSCSLVLDCLIYQFINKHHYFVDTVQKGCSQPSFFTRSKQGFREMKRNQEIFLLSRNFSNPLPNAYPLLTVRKKRNQTFQDLTMNQFPRRVKGPLDVVVVVVLIKC